MAATADDLDLFLETGYIGRTSRARAIGNANPAPNVPIEARPLSAMTEERRKTFRDEESAYRRLLAGAPIFDEHGQEVDRGRPTEYGPMLRIMVPAEDKPVEGQLSVLRRDYPDQFESAHRDAAFLSMGVSPAQIDIVYAE